MGKKNEDMFNFLNALLGGAPNADSDVTVTNSDSDINKAAWETKRLYDSFVRAGFTPDQAMTLICTFMSAIVSKGGSDA